MSLLALIPARGGSKAIPRKNIVSLAGHPLIAHTIECAREAAVFDRIIVSTDSPEIAEVSRQYGAEVPFLRPPEIAADTTSMLDVLVHFLDYAEGQFGGVEGIVLLQPTSPLRTPESVRRAIECYRENSADSVVTVAEVPHSCTPGSLLQRDENGRVSPAFPDLSQITRRQDKPRFFSRSGPAVLVLRPSTLRQGVLYTDSTYSVVLTGAEPFDVDDSFDLQVAEALIAAGLAKPALSLRSHS